jgi:hypothetical protein
MDLVFIYGPPATGKLTVSQELSKITGYRVFHNHASLDFVSTVFDFGTPKFSELVVKYRMDMLEEAAKEGISVIFTSSYVKGFSTKLTDKLVGVIEGHGGRVRFTYLHCDKDELAKRVGGESRKSFGKITDPAQLKDFLRTYDMPKEPPIKGSLCIDNTNLSPMEVAETIARHYGLERTEEKERASNTKVRSKSR